jgi:peptidoglycan/xylan/chitin deacetylase (PgdA/CDA1 family)
MPGSRALLAVLSIVLVAALPGCPDQTGRIPDRTIVLTFDDGERTQLTFVAPLLKEYGFGATFYFTGQWREDQENYLGFEELRPIHEMGFEIGNHSFLHFNYGDPALVPHIAEDLDKLENALAEVGIPRPETFAWPADRFGPEALEILRSRPMKFARRGQGPEHPPGLDRLGTLYDPDRHDPLLIPTAVTVGPRTSIRTIRRAIFAARDGKAAIIQFHGVPDTVNYLVTTKPAFFREILDLLRGEDCNVIALRDLARWVDPDRHPDDQFTGVRFD